MAGRPSVGQRRERKEVDGVLYLKCYGAFHDGEWMRSDRFRNRANHGVKGNQFETFCKECMTYKRAHDRGLSRYERLEVVRKWIMEIVHRCGGYNIAARTLGVTSSQLYRWLGRHKTYDSKWIRRESVKLIIQTLVDLRSGAISPDSSKRKKTWKGPYRYGCAGCGCALDLITPGCDTCQDRQVKRNYDAKLDVDEKRRKWREDAAKKRAKQKERLTNAA